MILGRDMARKLSAAEADEEEEKITLALSIVNFLKFVSDEDQTRYLLAK